MVKHSAVELKRIRGLMRPDIDMKKASTFIKRFRKEWRVE